MTLLRLAPSNLQPANLQPGTVFAPERVALGRTDWTTANTPKVIATTNGTNVRNYEQQKWLPVFYKGKEVGKFRADFVIADKIILELKAVKEINEIHEVRYHDPHVPCFHHDGLEVSAVADLDTALRWADCVVFATDHSAYDFAHVRHQAQLVVDTRGALRVDGFKASPWRAQARRVGSCRWGGWSDDRLWVSLPN